MLPLLGPEPVLLPLPLLLQVLLPLSLRLLSLPVMFPLLLWPLALLLVLLLPLPLLLLLPSLRDLRAATLMVSAQPITSVESSCN